MTSRAEELAALLDEGDRSGIWYPGIHAAAELRRLAAEVESLKLDAALAQAQSLPAGKFTDQRVTFDTWLRSACFQAPPDHAKDLARSAWIEADKQASADCEAMSEEIERLQKALAFWMPDVPSTDHPLYLRAVHDVYLLVGFDGPNPEPSAFELGHVVLSASPQPQPVQPSDTQPSEQAIRAALRSALAWGRVYGEVIPAHQWDEVREAQIDQAISALAAAPAAPEQQEPTDSMGMPVSCGKPLCSPGNHHPLCAQASNAQQAEAQEPVYWQWRRKADAWSLKNTFNTEVIATTDDSEVRPLFTRPQPAQLRRLDEDDLKKIFHASGFDIKYADYVQSALAAKNGVNLK